MNYTWTKEELEYLIQYENLLNQYYSYPKELQDESLLKKILLLEGKLILINKYVVVCKGGSANDILSFREYLRLEQKSLDQKNIITFFPINFINESKYVKSFI